MLKIGETLYSAETVKALIKQIYHFRDSDFITVTDAEREDQYFLAYSYLYLKPAQAAMIVARGTLDQEMRDLCEGFPRIVEMWNDNQRGDYVKIQFCFPLWD